MYLGDEAWPDLGSHFEDGSLALVPLGSTEQHGPHLPEGTDPRPPANNSSRSVTG